MNPVDPLKWTRSILWVLLVIPLFPGKGAGQQEPSTDIRREIQESQIRLEEIRTERSRLQQDMDVIRTRVRNVADELRNIERQISTSRSVLDEIQFQIDAVGEQAGENARALVRTRNQLRERSAILDRRLRDIYKRGPLHTVRVLLGAESFTDLVHRYRYLQMIATYDQALVANVRELERELVGQDRELQENLAELDRLRQFQLGEVAELRQVEEEHQRALESFRSEEREAMSEMERLEGDEARLQSLVTDLDRGQGGERARGATSGDGAGGEPGMSSEDMGRLEWPVEGQVIYRFGRDEGPDGTVLRWNGVGIAASRGTPVRAVRPGRVVLAGPFEGYGPAVILSHGDGFYTLYLYMEETGVVEGREVETGQVVGTVGGGGLFDRPHVEFQLRTATEGGAPQALDPLQWLRPLEDR